MSTRKCLLALGGSLLLGIAGVVHADATPGTNDLAAEVSSLKARIAQLEGRQSDAWLNDRRAEEVKTLVREVLADADTRASLLAEGATAGHDNGHFWVGSADGSFLLQLSGYIQARYTLNLREYNPDDSDQHDHGIGGTGVGGKVKFAGHVSSPKVGYALELASTNPRLDLVGHGNEVIVDQATISYCLADNLWVLVGRDKLPFLREELTDDTAQLAVDRSLVNNLFTIGRGQGIWSKWAANDMIHLASAISNGARTGEAGGNNWDSTSNTTAASGWGNADVAFTARADVKLAGEWAQMDDFTAWSGQPLAAFIGAAIHYQIRQSGDEGSADAVHNSDLLAWTVDGSLEVSGFNLYAAVVGWHPKSDDTTVSPRSLNFYGFLVQGGYQVIPDKLEAFVRWEMIDLDQNTVSATAERQPNLITFGGNWYVNKHQTKITADVVWALDRLDTLSGIASSTISDPAAIGLLPSSKENEVVLRAQAQVTF